MNIDFILTCACRHSRKSTFSQTYPLLQEELGNFHSDIEELRWTSPVLWASSHDMPRTWQLFIHLTKSHAQTLHCIMKLT